MEFVKVHGTGNDFVLLPDLGDRLTLDADLARALCDRHRGVGGDGVIRLGAPRDGGDVFMDYRNADGSIAEMCGTGVRCVAKYLADRGLAADAAPAPDRVAGGGVRVETRGGLKTVEVVGRHEDGTVAQVRVDMGAPEPTGTRQVDVSPERLAAAARHGGIGLAVTAEHRLVEVTTVSMGNPHAVVRVDDVARAPVAAWGPVIATDPAFAGGTNVEFVAVPAPDRVEGRIWERGVGETQASGTGASAMAVAAHLWGLAGREVVVSLPGGQVLVAWGEETLHVTGPAVEVARGQLDERWLAGATAAAGSGVRGAHPRARAEEGTG